MMIWTLSILCLLLIIPNTTSAAQINNPKRLKSYLVDLKIVESKDMSKMLKVVKDNWIKLSNQDQTIFKEEFKKLPKNLKKANRTFKKTLGEKIFSRDLIKKIKKLAKKPELITPKEFKNVQKNIGESMNKVWQMTFNDIKIPECDFGSDNEFKIEINK